MIPETLTLTFHRSRYPEAAAASASERLRRGELPPGVLYDSPAQAARWLAYHQACSPWRTDPSFETLYRQAFSATLARLPPGEPLVYVALGSGGGTKDALFLEGAAPRPVWLVPVDTSPALVLETVLRVGQAPCLAGLHPLVADLEREPPKAIYAPPGAPSGARRLYAAFGLLPNLSPGWLLGHLFDLLAPGDLLLLSANLSPGPMAAARGRILPQYDHPHARAWLLGGLAELGLDPAQVDLHIEPRAEDERGERWCIEATARLRSSATLVSGGAPLPLPPGAALRVFRSHRFTPAALESALAQAGLRCVAAAVHPSEEEGVYLCERA